ncbi:hypothetical protein [Glaciecola sp. 33A]|uniref:hypothetical protein n=1 Tax=Glaciecola sp. 33A TaxID=2057807 RepID=UPI0012FF015D
MPNIDGIHLLKKLSQLDSYNDRLLMVVSGLSKIDIDHRGGLPMLFEIAAFRQLTVMRVTT